MGIIVFYCIESNDYHLCRVYNGKIVTDGTCTSFVQKPHTGVCTATLNVVSLTLIVIGMKRKGNAIHSWRGARNQRPVRTALRSAGSCVMREASRQRAECSFTTNAGSQSLRETVLSRRPGTSALSSGRLLIATL